MAEQGEMKFIKYEETVNKQRIPSGNGLINASAYWVQAITPLLGVVGDADDSGTEILEINIPAGYVFVCVIIKFGCNEARSVRVCTVGDTLVLGDASQVERYLVDGQNIGNNGDFSAGLPVFVVDNSAGATALDLLLYAPKTIYGVANNPITAYFEAFLGGILYKGDVAEP